MGQDQNHVASATRYRIMWWELGGQTILQGWEAIGFTDSLIHFPVS